MRRRVAIAIALWLITALFLYFMPPSYSNIIWLGMLLASVSVFALVYITGQLRISVYVGGATLLALYLQWQHITSWEFFWYGLGCVAIIEFLVFLISQVW